MTKNKIVTPEGLNRTLTRLAHEIIEQNSGGENVVFLGIRSRGVPLAERIIERIFAVEQVRPPLGVLDVTMYRDDVFENIKLPSVQTTDIGFKIGGKVVILVDDVLFTGRTVRAALDAIMDFGRPKCIQLAVLVDRGHRELPIRADYVGKNIPTSQNQEVKVLVKEIDNQDGIYLINSGEET